MDKKKEKPKCQHFRCNHEINWDTSRYNVTSLSDGVPRYSGVCPNCGTNYLHDVDGLNEILNENKQ